MIGREISWEELCKSAHDKHKLTFEDQKGADNRPLTLTDLHSLNTQPQQFIMNNFFEAGELVIISGAAKTGKSNFLLDVLSCIASKGKISDRIFSKKACNVALIDAELSIEALSVRAERMKDLYPNSSNWTDRFSILSAKHERKEFDLSKTDDQQWLEKRIGNATVVSFDNYGKLACSSGDGLNTWRKVSSWFERLQQKGITIILIHHENKNEEIRGTGKMVDDADLHLALKRPQIWQPQDGNIIEVHFQAPRHLHGDQLIPFTIKYEETNRGFQRHIGTLGESQNSPVSNTEVQNHKLSTLQIEILSFVRLHGEVRAKDIVQEEQKGRTYSTVRKAFISLCEKNLIKCHGLNKGSYYTPN